MNEFSVPVRMGDRRKAVNIVFTMVIIALFVSTVILSFGVFVFGRYEVNGTSMEPTFVNGDLLRGNKLKTPQRFDAVVIKKGAVEPDRRLIKRVVGVAGDTLSVVLGEDGCWRLHITGQDGFDETLWHEDYGNGDIAPLMFWFSNEVYPWSNGDVVKYHTVTVTVPDGCVMVFGDLRGKDANGNTSKDSKTFGPVKLEDIEAVILKNQTLFKRG